jgi:hypothetical protein
VRHAMHASLPGVALNEPDGHWPHTRSDDAPGGVVWYSPATHTLMAWHTRSAWSCGAANVYWPSGHAALCVLQPRSLEVVAALDSYSPDWHSVTGRHVAPDSMSENSTPTWHVPHPRSAVADPALDAPEPAGHVAHAVHLLSPTVAVNVPSAQLWHTRSVVTVAMAVM